MDQVITIVSLFIGALIIWTYMKSSKKINQLKIDPQDAKKRLDTEKEIILLDVRTREEYIDSHIPKSTLIPLNLLAQEACEKLPNKQATIFAYCRSGNRSKAAVRILLKQGYTNVFNLGGILRWPYKTVSGKR